MILIYKSFFRWYKDSKKKCSILVFIAKKWRKNVSQSKCYIVIRFSKLYETNNKVGLR